MCVFLIHLYYLETPPGQESRLTRAMKAYHVEKARDPADLPEWLFEEHERRPVGRSRFTNGRQNDRQGDEYGDNDPDVAPAPRSRGLRDIYDSAAAPDRRTPARSERSAPSRYNEEPAGSSSKATNRLKALRDAKRQNNRFDDDPPLRSATSATPNDRRDVDGGRRRDRDRGAEESDRRGPSRTGLPTGPGGRARRV